MVSWRSLRPVLVTLLLIATAIIISASTLVGTVPFQYLADFRARITGPDLTPTAIPLVRPEPAAGGTAVIPIYPAVVIVPPAKPAFAIGIP